MKVLDVSYERLASLLVLNTELEKRPEPWRGQSTITFRIDFVAYTEFIDKVLKRKDFLSTKTSLLKEYLDSGNIEGLIGAFYRDMCFAVLKELSFLPSVNTNATKIRHSNVTLSDGANLVMQRSALGNGLINNMISDFQQSGYTLPLEYSATNIIEFDYAYTLYCYSIAKIPFNIE